MSPASRAEAHLRWAERYDRQSNTSKAAAHFGRALEYDRRAKLEKRQKFGTNDWDGGGLGLHDNIRTVADAAKLAATAVPVVTTLVTATGAVAVNNLYELYKSLFTPSEPAPNPKLLSYSLLLQEKQIREKAKQLQGVSPQLAAAAPTRTLSLGSGSGGVGTNALAPVNLQPNRQITPVQKPERGQIPTAPKPEPEPNGPEMQVIRAEGQHRRYFSNLKKVIDSIDIKNKKLLLEYTEECIKAHDELQEAKQDAGVIASAASWLMGKGESQARKRAKAFEQAINALLAGNKGPMNVPPEKQQDVEDRHSEAYAIMLQNKGILKLRYDVLCSSEPYNKWPSISCMKQALSDIYVIVEDAVFTESEKQNPKT
ncbi:MAG: hypothetical protein EBZ77_07035 [Chitinophagia bacterium]|nr:hypothetical protein [Chitinophagia bacterium]